MLNVFIALRFSIFKTYLTLGEIKLFGDQLHLFLPFSLGGKVQIKSFKILIKTGPFAAVDTAGH